MNPIAKRWLAALVLVGAALVWQINGLASDIAPCSNDVVVCQAD